jgi:hypothetical protein
MECHVAQSFHATWHQYQYFFKVQGPIPIFLQSAGTNTNSFVFFFNRKLTEGPIPIFLQSVGTNSKQKKCKDQFQNLMKVHGLNAYLSLNCNKLVLLLFFLTNEQTNDNYILSTFPKKHHQYHTQKRHDWL